MALGCEKKAREFLAKLKFRDPMNPWYGGEAQAELEKPAIVGYSKVGLCEKHAHQYAQDHSLKLKQK
jgi:hypothetical protein